MAEMLSMMQSFAQRLESIESRATSKQQVPPKVEIDEDDDSNNEEDTAQRWRNKRLRQEAPPSQVRTRNSEGDETGEREFREEPPFVQLIEPAV